MLLTCDWMDKTLGSRLLNNLLNFLSRSTKTDTLNREASERFAAGYIQCMHEVHMFVSICPGIDSTVAAELLNHLLECMPLNEDHLQDVLMDLFTDTAGNNSSTWHCL
ncbi:hairy-related 13 [Xyrichtys novacula]|uniref:Hairy-related 13 n=1 Tax=Xyrichtys novacula TaxID=13765 RepID=A0AAV1FZY7_XYRNO|nr:hairy-related 13 [Xyrichtys novacula]